MPPNMIEKTVRCAAFDEHLLSVMVDEGLGEAYIIVNDFFRARSVWSRLKRAIKTLVTGDDWATEIILRRTDALDFALFIIQSLNNDLVVHNAPQDEVDEWLLGV